MPQGRYGGRQPARACYNRLPRHLRLIVPSIKTLQISILNHKLKLIIAVKVSLSE